MHQQHTTSVSSHGGLTKYPCVRWQWTDTDRIERSFKYMRTYSWLNVIKIVIFLGLVEWKHAQQEFCRPTKLFHIFKKNVDELRCLFWLVLAFRTANVCVEVLGVVPGWTKDDRKSMFRTLELNVWQQGLTSQVLESESDNWKTIFVGYWRWICGCATCFQWGKQQNFPKRGPFSEVLRDWWHWLKVKEKSSLKLKRPFRSWSFCN